MDKVLNIYGQPMEHMDAEIVGTRAGLEALKSAIDNALEQGRFTLGAVGDPLGDPLWASDGEGYNLKIILKPDEWWLEPSQVEDQPFYHRVLDGA